MKLYVIDNYGRENMGQDITIGYADSREAVQNVIENDRAHLTDKEFSKIGGKYIVSVYPVPVALESDNLRTVFLDMADEGLLDYGAEMSDQYMVEVK